MQEQMQQFNVAPIVERRRNQRTGYVYRRGDSWFGQFRVDTTERSENGRFKRKKLTKFIAPAAGPGAVTYKRAVVLFYDAELRDLHRSGPLSMKTLREFVKERFEPDVVCSCKPAGKRHYGGMLRNHVLPAVGELRMRDFRPQHVYELIKAKLDWRGKDGERLSVQTVTHVRNTLSAIFRHAKRMQAYSGDIPTEGVRLPPLVHAEKRPLTWVQVQAVAAVIGYPDPAEERKKGSAPVDPVKCAADNLQLGALVRVLALTGLRIGEAMGLRWKHVDFEKGVVRVRENFTRGQYGTLKTARSRRDVPLHSLAIAELTKLQHSSICNLELPVFAGRTSGKPLDQHNIAARFLKPAGKRAGCPWVSWHVLRHTAATLAHGVGLSIEQRQKVLGHAGAEMTIRYTHPELEAVRKQLEQIGQETKLRETVH
jgi:integrase